MQIGTTTPDNLIAGDFPRVTDWLTIPSGVLARGTVLDRYGNAINPGGAPFAVLAEDADASSGAVRAPVYLTGEFSKAYLLLNGGAAMTDTDVVALRSLSIFVKTTIPAV